MRFACVRKCSQIHLSSEMIQDVVVFTQVMLGIKDKLSPLVSDYNILLAINNAIAERKKGLTSLNHDVTVSAMVNLVIDTYWWWRISMNICHPEQYNSLKYV